MKEITKEKFVSIMETIKKEYDSFDRVNTLLGEIFEDGQGFYKSYCYNELIELLKYIFNDFDYSNIEYFIYDLEFGKKYKLGMITDKDGKDIDFSSSDKLYDYLITQ